MKKITFLFFVLFAFSVNSQTETQKIQEYLNSNYSTLGITSQDINDWYVESEATSTSTGITNYYVKQRYQGIELFHAQTNFSIKNGNVVYVANRFESNIAQRVNTTTPAYSVLDALSLAYGSFNITPIESFQIQRTIRTNYYQINDAIGINEPVLAKLVYQLNEENKLRLAWDFTFYSPNHKNLWSVRIDAKNGEILEKQDMVVSCSFGNDSDHSKHQHYVPFTKQLFKEESATSVVETQSGSYRVLPYNIESPNHGERQLISTPHHTTASPFGWHDTNGAVGAEFTITRGNNTWAKEDRNGTNSVFGAAPNGGAILEFDFPYGGNSAQSATYTNAATTNLFYMTNVMHDVWYQYGFDEANGNYQANNYGKGGTAGDFVYADSQDGVGTNNANFSAPVDGLSGRVQMFLWDVGPPNYSLTVNSPATIAGPYAIRDNNFIPGNVPLPIAPNGFTTDLVLFDDGSPDNSDACSPAINAAAISGKVCILRRGDCTFVEKVKNAQNAGALAVIVVNNVEGVIIMGGADATITIPAISVNQDVGEAIIAQMSLGVVNVTLQTPADVFINADGSFDNGIISHEFGHGISIRLAGGRNNSSCLQNAEQMGEGWSDWFALMMQLKPGDVGTAIRGIGTFAVSQPIDGVGIRTYPYSTDMSINPMTFNSTNTEAVPHGVGSVWATTLWDLTWAYINKYGYDSNIYTGTGGNNKIMRLVLDGLKLQPCSPTFIESRDALIAADQATTGGQDYCMIWEVFANRGLGLNASSGNRNSSTDQVEDFSMPPAGPNCVLSVDYFATNEVFKVYPNPSNGMFTIQVNQFSGKVAIQIVDLNGRIVYQENEVNFNNAKNINITHLQSGMYIVKVNADELNFSQKIIKN
jgi:extracellular elastinolytic metalloproteinase